MPHHLHFQKFLFLLKTTCASLSCFRNFRPTVHMKGLECPKTRFLHFSINAEIKVIINSVWSNVKETMKIFVIYHSYHGDGRHPKSPDLFFILKRMVSDMVYYGLSLNAEDLSENIYLNVFLLNFVELAAYVFCLVFLDKAGRKLLMCFSMLLGGVACVSTIFPVMYGGESKIF